MGATLLIAPRPSDTKIKPVVASVAPEIVVHSNRIAPWQKGVMTKAHKAGKSLQEMAAAAHVDQSTARRFLKRKGLKPNNQPYAPITQEQRDAVLKAHADPAHLSIRKIGTAAGTSDTTAARILRDNDLEPHNPPRRRLTETEMELGLSMNGDDDRPTTATVARRLDTTAATIGALWKRHGLKANRTLRKMTPVMREQLLTIYYQDETAEEAGRKVGLTRWTVGDFWTSQGLKTGHSRFKRVSLNIKPAYKPKPRNAATAKRPNATRAQRDTMRTEITRGRSFTQTAKLAGVNRYTVGVFAQAEGLQSRFAKASMAQRERRVHLVIALKSREVSADIIAKRLGIRRDQVEDIWRSHLFAQYMSDERNAARFAREVRLLRRERQRLAAQGIGPGTPVNPAS